MGEDLLDGLRELAKRFPFIGDVRGKGLMTAIEFVADPATMALLPPSVNIGQRVLDLAYERGLIVYFRRVNGGVQGDCVMVAPPLIVTRERDRRDRLDPRRRDRCRRRANSTCRSTARESNDGAAKSHHHLRRHRLGAHAVDVAPICR